MTLKVKNKEEQDEIFIDNGICVRCGGNTNNGTCYNCNALYGVLNEYKRAQAILGKTRLCCIVNPEYGCTLCNYKCCDTCAHIFFPTFSARFDKKNLIVDDHFLSGKSHIPNFKCIS